MRSLYFAFSSFASRVIVSSAAVLLLRAGAAVAQSLPPNNPSQDQDRNWTVERTYDGNNNVVSESKQFTDGLGRPTQAQARNAATKQVFATQTVYNAGGKPVLETLAAPINNQGFRYHEGFFTYTDNGQTVPYSAQHFEGGNANSPRPADATAVGTLGYYFSQLNTQEPLTPITSYPFSLVEPYEGPLGGTRRAASPGDELRMGKGREAKGREFPLRKEFDAYLTLRPQFVPGSPFVTMEYQGTKSVSVNADGRESIVVTNKEGQAIISCLSGSQYPGLPVYGFISSDATNRYDANAPVYQDIHIPAAGSQDVKFTMGSYATSGGKIRIVNLITDQSTDYTIAPPAYAGAEPELHVTLDPGFYRFVSVEGTQWSYYEAHYGDLSYTYYNEAGQVVATIAPKGLPGSTTLRNVSSFVTRNDYDTSGRLLTTESIDEGRSEYVYARDGRIRFSQSALQRPSGRFSYSNYDEVGRVVESGEYTPSATGTSGVEFEGHGSAGAKQAATSQLLEAEKATFLNSHSGQIDPVWSASNGYEVAHLNIVGSFVQFSAPLGGEQAGTYELQVRYSNGMGNPRTMTMYVNTQSGQTAQTVTFAPTAGWDSFTTLRLNVLLEGGNNTIRFEYTNADNGSINLDYLRVTSPLMQEAEEADFQNSRQNKFYDLASASGGREVDYLTAIGNYVEFTVTPTGPVGSAGFYELQLGYSAAAGGVRTMNMRVVANSYTYTNRQLSFQPTANWETFSTLHTTTWLQMGVPNKIRIEYTSADNGIINLDYLRAAASASIQQQEAEQADFVNNNGNRPNTGLSAASGGQDVGHLTLVGTYVRFAVIAAQAGTYTLRLRYSVGAPPATIQTMSLLVNEEAPKQLSFPGTYSWAQFSTVSTTAVLRPGLNTIQVLYGPNDAGFIDLDYLQVEGQITPLAHDQSVHDLVEDRTRTGGLTLANCAQRNQVWYDLPWDGTAKRPDGTVDPDHQDSQLTNLNRKQEFTVGAVAKTKNENVTTWYSYDELGRVTWVVQDIAYVGVKTLDYKYDFSGNVLEVAYQKDQADRFYHYYTYDAAQRLIAVATSTDGNVRTMQAEYSYYLHGPLKRVKVAGDLQGVDYTYTLQGALKSINHVNQTLEPGHDSPNSNGVQKDLFALTLDYFSGDYRSRNLDVAAPTDLTGVGVPTRYDGTIQGAAWRTAASSDVHRVAYTYDEKSQLRDAQYGPQFITSSTTSNFLPTNRLREGNLSYDANGNMKSLSRTDQQGATTDNFSYSYKPNTNQLAEVHTGSASGPTVLDYDYDELGQMIRQRDEQGQRYFTYDVTGKTTGVYFDAAHNQPLVLFAYDDRGFRVRKTTFPQTAGATLQTTIYVRDVAGNILATYEKVGLSGIPQRTEVPIYGSGRLGTLTRLNNGTEDYRYELTDHLGDARVVFHRPTTDTGTETMELSGVPAQYAFQGANTYRAAPASGGHNGSTYVAELDGRQASPPTLSRSVTVQQGDTITFTAWAKVPGSFNHPNRVATSSAVQPYLLLGAATATDETPTRLPDGQLTRTQTGAGRWLGRLAAGLSITLPSKKQPLPLGTGPASKGTPYNAWIKYQVFDVNGQPVYGQEQTAYVLNNGAAGWQQLRLGVRVPQGGTVELTAASAETNSYVFFDDLEVKQTGGLIVQEQHQYAFGAPLPGLSYTVGNRRYRYGYQGQYAEHDTLTGFESFELRIYNSRIGRWLSTDPEGQFDSPYVGMGNNSISRVDPNGGFAPSHSVLNNWQQFKVWLGLGRDGGALFGYLAGKGVMSAGARAIGNGLLGAGARQGAWLLFNGTSLNWYSGNTGDRSHLVASFKASSGYFGVYGGGISDFRNSQFQDKKGVGPVPEATYSINLSLNQDRVAKMAYDNKNLAETHGIQKINEYYPTGVPNTYHTTGADWGSLRARLETPGGRDVMNRNNFYLHNSHKGFSHGCIEVPDFGMRREKTIFGRLAKYSKSHSLINLVVDYPGLNVSTKGNTKY